MAYAVSQLQSGEFLEVGDGVYDEAIATATFPTGEANEHTEMRAENAGYVDVTGGFSLYGNQVFYQTYRGLRFTSATGVGVAGGRAGIFLFRSVHRGRS
ncbi:MAG: hypothetical protein GY822_11420 [Deltaproteobacteria bacterium]|nr:hypothetical protein [Deltaproteobacteria bacterium]